MRTNHDDALFERATLGGSAIAFAVIVSLGSRDNDLDVFLRIAMCLAFFAMPVLLAPWIGKDKVFPSDPGQEGVARPVLATFVTVWVCAGISLITALAAILAHVFGWKIAIVGLIWMMLWVHAAIPGTKKKLHIARDKQPIGKG